MEWSVWRSRGRVLMLLPWEDVGLRGFGCTQREPLYENLGLEPGDRRTRMQE